MQSVIIEKCARLLLKRNITVAFVESATAGRICAEFALAEGAGTFLAGGIVCYQAGTKERLLRVPHELLQQYTAESAEVTRELAANGLQLLQADIVVAVTGLLSPGGSETPEKPVGTMFLQLHRKDRELAHREVFSGEAADIMLQTVHRVAELLLHFAEPFPEIL